MSINPGVVLSVRMVADNLSDEELSAIYMAASAGFDPRNVAGYEKAKNLFSEFNGTKMHSETLEVLGVIVDERL